VEDVRRLLINAQKNLAYSVDVADIVSLRAGVRPLAVKTTYSRRDYPRDLSRRHACDVDRDRAAITVFGGKFTGAAGVAREVADSLAQSLAPRFQPVSTAPRAQIAAQFRFAGLEAPLIDPSHAARHEHCQTLFDYTRRRTNLDQWTRRHGLGRGDVYAPELRTIATAIEGGDRAERALEFVRGLAKRRDELLDQV
jgi:glycerol-3-phosphate dehydrogenase